MLYYFSMASLGPSNRIPNSAPARQKAFVLEIVRALDNPVEAQYITKEYLEEASEYINKLKGEHAIDEYSKSKIMIALMPIVPKLPPGYKNKTENQKAFLNKTKSKFSSSFNLATIPNSELKEAMYYAETLKNYNSIGVLSKEQMRRIKPPFRLPEPSRPNMPNQAGIPPSDLLSLLLNRIYIGSAAKQKEAYDTLVDVYLTDWVNRKGYKNTTTGQQLIRLPFVDNPQFLIYLDSAITKYLKQCEERPNPKTLKKMAGNSYRQQLFKDLLEKVNTRLALLQAEEFNDITKKTRESKGGRRTRKNKYYKRGTLRRN